jgi:hypothetical protein
MWLALQDGKQVGSASNQPDLSTLTISLSLFRAAHAGTATRIATAIISSALISRCYD